MVELQKQIQKKERRLKKVDVIRVTCPCCEVTIDIESPELIGRKEEVEGREEAKQEPLEGEGGASEEGGAEEEEEGKEGEEEEEEEEETKDVQESLKDQSEDGGEAKEEEEEVKEVREVKEEDEEEEEEEEVEGLPPSTPHEDCTNEVEAKDETFVCVRRTRREIVPKKKFLDIDFSMSHSRRKKTQKIEKKKQKTHKICDKKGETVEIEEVLRAEGEGICFDYSKNTSNFEKQTCKKPGLLLLWIDRFIHPFFFPQNIIKSLKKSKKTFFEAGHSEKVKHILVRGALGEFFRDFTLEKLKKKSLFLAEGMEANFKKNRSGEKEEEEEEEKQTNEAQTLDKTDNVETPLIPSEQISKKSYKNAQKSLFLEDTTSATSVVSENVEDIPPADRSTECPPPSDPPKTKRKRSESISLLPATLQRHRELLCALGVDIVEHPKVGRLVIAARSFMAGAVISFSEVEAIKCESEARFLEEEQRICENGRGTDSFLTLWQEQKKLRTIFFNPSFSKADPLSSGDFWYLINHDEKSPNCRVFPHTSGLGIVLEATRDIKELEPLTWKYPAGFWEGEEADEIVDIPPRVVPVYE